MATLITMVTMVTITIIIEIIMVLTHLCIQCHIETYSNRTGVQYLQETITIFMKITMVSNIKIIVIKSTQIRKLLVNWRKFIKSTVNKC